MTNCNGLGIDDYNNCVDERLCEKETETPSLFNVRSGRQSASNCQAKKNDRKNKNIRNNDDFQDNMLVCSEEKAKNKR